MPDETMSADEMLEALNVMIARAEKAEAKLELARLQREAMVGAAKESLRLSGYTPDAAHPAENVLAATLAAVEGRS